MPENTRVAGKRRSGLFALDKNHDGTMDLSWNGPDTTTPASPMEAWVNDGLIIPGTGGNLDKDVEVSPNTPPNYSYGQITCPRDLENFFRLWICGMPELPANQGYTVSLSISPISGNPAVNLYWSCESDGGVGYLTDTNTAAQQIVNIGGTGYGVSIGTVSNNLSYTFPDGTFQLGGTQHLLFEGAGIGEGQLTLTISQNGTALAQASAYIDLRDIQDFYERAVIADNTSGAISNWSSAIETTQYSTANLLGDDTNLIVFVHGFNVDDWNWLDDSDTVLKRLYWAGFQGKFMTVKWPDETLSFWNLLNSETMIFNDSEIRAYKASGALKTYLDQLKVRFPDYRLNIYAHSQGNAVVSEAIEQGAPFDTYILTQGALPDSSYDVDAPTYDGLVADENTYGPTPENAPMGYRGAYTNFAGQIINFYNTNDPVLAIWQSDQGAAKPNLPSTDYHYDGTVGTFEPLIGSGYVVTDPEESRAYVSRSRTLSVGQSPPESAHGVIQSGVDLTAHFKFGSVFPDDHSAQWTQPIQTTYLYYKQILLEIQPTP